jgi:hypothetical protein
MHLKEIYEKKMQPRLDELKEEIDELRQKAGEAETNLELEYYTLLDEAQVELETASWDSLRELVKSVTSP